jgi:hypothetical protein
VKVTYVPPTESTDGAVAVDLPTHVGAVRIAAACGSFLSGLRAATSIAASIANNPVLSAVLPPGTGAALNAVNQIANAHARGGPVAAQQAAQQFSGPGGARLQAALAEQPMPARRGGGMMPGGRYAMLRLYGVPG